MLVLQAEVGGEYQNPEALGVAAAMTYWQATQIVQMWHDGKDTASIAEQLNMREAKVEQFIFDRLIKRQKVAA